MEREISSAGTPGMASSSALPRVRADFRQDIVKRVVPCWWTSLEHPGRKVNGPVEFAHDEEPLTLLVHWADYRTAHVFEDEWPVEEDAGYFDRAQRNSTL